MQFLLKTEENVNGGEDTEKTKKKKKKDKITNGEVPDASADVAAVPKKKKKKDKSE